MASPLNCAKHLKLLPILHKLFQKTEEAGTLPNWFYEASTTLIAKPDKVSTREESYRPMSLMDKDEKKNKQVLKQTNKQKTSIANPVT